MKLSNALFTLLAAKLASAQDCDAKCRGQLGSSWENDQHAFSDFHFYQAPAKFSPSTKPGTVLAVEEATSFANYSIPAGLTMSRILYATSDLNGTVLPTSAYVLWPYTALTGKDASQGYPMVAWAHGTSGVLKGCAPSNYRNLQYHFMAPFQLALQGMAVVAPDYAGLGVSHLPNGDEINHPWGAAPAHANDLANAIIAARSAFPQYLRPSGRFVAMGHSQGGQTAWAFAERQVKQPIAGYKGAVSIAPPDNLIHQIERALANPSAPWAATILTAQTNLVSAVTAAYPAYNYSGMSDESYDRWINIMKPAGACLPTSALVFADLTPAALVKENWTKDATVQAYAKRIDTGRKSFKGPLLVLAGESDEVVPHQTVESTVDDTCKLLTKGRVRESLEMVSFGGMDHFPVIQASSLKWMAWIKDRLSDSPRNVRSGCKKSDEAGFRTEFTPKVPFPNFLEGWAPASEMWKYLL